MATFKYKAATLDGAAVSGIIDAYDQYEAIDQIKTTYGVLLSIKEVHALPKEGIQLGTPKVNPKALALLCSQFSIILTAGLPVVRCVQLIEEQTTDKLLKKLLTQVAEDVDSGYGLAQSLENKGKKILPITFIETVRAGEESGTLEISFKKLQTYYEKSSKVQSQVRSAMMYPAFLSIMAVLVIAVIMSVLMPTMKTMFEGLGTEMPAVTQALISASDFMAHYWWLVGMILASIIIAFKIYVSTENGGVNFARAQLRFPALGKVAQTKGASQLANTLSTLITAGLPMIQSVAVTARVLDNQWLGQRLGAMVPQLEEGRPFGECLRQCDCFPALLCEMAAVGEETGSLEETLGTIGLYFDSEVEVATKRALGVLQPAITIVMGAVIGIIVISIYLPMFSMYGAM